MPGILQSFDKDKGTCTVQVAIRGTITDEKQNTKVVDIPILEDVPVLMLGGGGYSVTMPLKKGDEGLVHFSSRCIDGWWQNGGVQSPAEYRMHNLSDGFFVPGFRSQPRKLSDVSDNDVVIRSDDNKRKITISDSSISAEISDTRKITIDDTSIKAQTPEGNVELSAASAKLTHSVMVEHVAPVIKLNGAVVIGAGHTITAENGAAVDFGGSDMKNIGRATANEVEAGSVNGSSVVSNGIDLATHIHTAPSGGGPTTPPVTP